MIFLTRVFQFAANGNRWTLLIEFVNLLNKCLHDVQVPTDPCLDTSNSKSFKLFLGCSL